MSSANSAYSPLPQSNSDSDGSSEEELHVLQENRVVNRVSNIQNSKTEKAYNGKKQNVINYKPLDTDGDIGVTLMKFQTTSDEVSILKPNNNIEIFSTSRKICFVLSLLLCIFTTVVFIWILPCNVSTCLSASNTKNYVNDWDRSLSGLELYGPISLISGSAHSNQNLIFFLRTPSNSYGKKVFKNGLISFRGINGGIIWQTNLNKPPTDIDCQLVDIDLDGINDCLLIGSDFLKAIHSLSGKELWDIQESNKNIQLKKLDFPLIISDLDGDEVKDYLTSSSLIMLDGKNHSNILFQNYLILISGRTGVIINEPSQIKMCSAVHNLMFENSSVVSYICYNSTEKESIQTISLTNIFNTVKNISKETLSLQKRGNERQHKRSQAAVHVNSHTLVLENQGHCPEECILLLDVKDEQEKQKNKTLLSYRYKNAYGMTPVLSRSKNTGFIIKLWKWYPRKETMLNNSSSLDKEMFLESVADLQRVKRTANSLSKSKQEEKFWNSSDLNLRIIRESIIGIFFNGSQHFTKNLTEGDIIQVCRKGQSCEPDVSRQKYSMLVADLDEDGSDELISFSARYIHEETKSKEANESWQLQSRVLVIRL